MNEAIISHPEVTEFVNDFLQYRLQQNGYQWSSPRSSEEAGRHIASRVGAALRTLADEFSTQYKQHFVEMCEKLDINECTLQPTIVGVANELFSEGIKWARIVAFFVFGSELAVHCQEKNWPHLVDNIAVSLSSYITEKLVPWINDHGGWEGLITFNEGARSTDQQNGGSWPSMKNLLCLVISAFGAFSLGAFLSRS